MASDGKGDSEDEQDQGFPITCTFSLQEHVPMRQP